MNSVRLKLKLCLNIRRQMEKHLSNPGAFTEKWTGKWWTQWGMLVDTEERILALYPNEKAREK